MLFAQRSIVKNKKTANELYYRFQRFTHSFHLVLCAPFAALTAVT